MILDDLVLLLSADNSVPLTDATNLFGQELPDSPDEAVVVREYGGPPPVETMGHHLAAVEVYSVQVMVRSTTVPNARLLAHKVDRVLRNIGPATTMNSNLQYLACLPNAMPYPMALDDEQRVLYVTNYTVHRHPPTNL